MVMWSSSLTRLNLTGRMSRLKRVSEPIAVDAIA
jgi:hypothetical protein